MKDRKGQFGSIVGLAVVIFILSGNIFGVVATDSMVEDTFEYNIGSFNPIANAKMKADHHEPKMERELNYSSNIVGIRLGEESGGDFNWDNEVPSTEELQQHYYEQVGSELESQNRVKNCEPPTLGEIEEQDRPVSWHYNNTSMKVSFTDPWISCNSQNTQARVKTVEELRVDNVRNRYIGLANYSSELAGNAEEHIPDQMTGSGSDDGSSCPESRSTERGEAIANAKDNAKDSSLAADVFSADSADREGWIGLDSSSSSFSFSGTSDTTPSDCTYNCPAEGEEGSCSEGTQYSATADYEVTSATLSWSLSDSEKTIINSEGQDQMLVFNITKTYSLTG